MQGFISVFYSFIRSFIRFQYVASLSVPDPVLGILGTTMDGIYALSYY